MKQLFIRLFCAATAVLLLAGCASQQQSTSTAGQTVKESSETNVDAPESPDAQTAPATKTIDYPTKAITLYCGFSAGGSSDIMCRLVATKMQELLGQPVTVVNKTGGGGWVCWNEIIKSVEPDGYTFTLINTPNYSMGAYDATNPREYKFDDLDLLMNQVTDYCTLSIKKDETRFHDMVSFIEYAKENEILSAANAVGIMSDDGTVMNRLNQSLGTKITAVQTNGFKDNETMLLNGSIDVLVANVSEVANANKNGDYKVICIFGPDEDPYLPGVPTCTSLGYGDIIGHSSRGYALPKGVDSEIREILNDALRRAIEDPEVMQQLQDMGTNVNILEGQDYYQFLEEDIETCKHVYGIE